jgi:hypothetical protein
MRSVGSRLRVRILHHVIAREFPSVREALGDGFVRALPLLRLVPVYLLVVVHDAPFYT